MLTGQRATEVRPWMIVAWVTIFLVGTDLFVVSPFLPLIAAETNREPESLTWLVSAFSVTYAIACPLQGRLAERIGTAKVLLGGVALIAAGNLLTALSPGLPFLLASRVVAGLGAASISPMLYSLASELAGPERRGADLALVNSGLLVALTMGAPLGLCLGGFSGWREVFGILAMAFAVVLPFHFATWRGKGGGPRTVFRREEVLREPLLAAWPHLLAMVCWSWCVYSVYTMLGTALRAEYQASVRDVAVFLSVFGAGATWGSLRGGRMADRIGASRMTALSFLAMLATTGSMACVYPLHRPWATALALFAFSLSAYGFFPALQACAAQRFTMRRPTVMGMVSSALYVGLTLGSITGGVAYRHSGMSAVLLMAFAPCLMGLAAALRLDSSAAPGFEPPATSRTR